MNSLVARNTNFLAPRMYHLMQQQGVPEKSRNGPVLRLPGTTSVMLSHPLERVHFDPTRRCNPFFHLFEALAMMADFNSVSFLSFFAKNMANYSDDGASFNAFYGTRMNLDSQFLRVSQLLRDDPDTRRAVVSLWDHQDLFRITKDMACNLCMIFSVDQLSGKLEMTTFNRSNDAVWGFATGANIVHFAFFHELMAALIGRSVGAWYHTSANMHVYTNRPDWQKLVNRYQGVSVLERDLYTSNQVAPAHLCEGFDPGIHILSFISEVREFIQLCDAATKVSSNMELVLNWRGDSVFLHTIARPMFYAYWAHKNKLLQTEALKALHNTIARNDWITAGIQWVESTERGAN